MDDDFIQGEEINESKENSVHEQVGGNESVDVFQYSSGDVPGDPQGDLSDDSDIISSYDGIFDTFDEQVTYQYLYGELFLHIEGQSKEFSAAGDKVWRYERSLNSPLLLRESEQDIEVKARLQSEIDVQFRDCSAMIDVSNQYLNAHLVPLKYRLRDVRDRLQELCERSVHSSYTSVGRWCCHDVSCNGFRGVLAKYHDCSEAYLFIQIMQRRYNHSCAYLTNALDGLARTSERVFNLSTVNWRNGYSHDLNNLMW